MYILLMYDTVLTYLHDTNSAWCSGGERGAGLCGEAGRGGGGVTILTTRLFPSAGSFCVSRVALRARLANT